jgi:hypothetical protein
MQHILVCADDAVLAKKLRFLLSRDERTVQILGGAHELEPALRGSAPALLILGRLVGREDALTRVLELARRVPLPPVIVLGGAPAPVPSGVQLLPDPFETQAIHRVTAELLSDSVEREDSSPPAPIFAISAEPPREPASIDALPARREPEGLEPRTGLAGHPESEPVSDPSSYPSDTSAASALPAAEPPRLPPTDSSPTRGELEPARFAKALFECWSRTSSGALVIARAEETITLHLERGAPVLLESNLPGDAFGRWLVNRGRISEVQYGDAAKRAIERGLRLGPTLVELGFLSAAELGRELGTSAREQLVACFEARQGSFEFEPHRRPTSDERPFRLELAHVIAEGIRRHADAAMLEQVLGDTHQRYFKLRRSLEDLRRTFPLTERDIAFLEYSGRAYKIADASELSELPSEKAGRLLALLTLCEEIEDFTPTAVEFEARIREERQRTKELELRMSQLPQKSSGVPASSGAIAASPVAREEPSSLPRSNREESTLGAPRPISRPASALPPPFDASRIPAVAVQPRTATPLPVPAPFSPPPVPPPTPTLPHAPPPLAAPVPPPFAAPAPVAPPPAPIAAPPVPAQSSPVSASAGDDIPPMPVPGPGEEGTAPRPLVYAKPLPRTPDGLLLETPERALSRDHFQRGVNQLGLGQFTAAEEAFRDAVALCSEEHVYLIGLARAVYYNPAYHGAGKLPMLNEIVARAHRLAPEDKRVATLLAWVAHAEESLSDAYVTDG